MSRPSGDHTGLALCCDALKVRRVSEPDGSMIQMSPPVAS